MTEKKKTKAKKETFRIKRSYGLIYYKDSQALKCFFEVASLTVYWPLLEDDKLYDHPVTDEESLKNFMYMLLKMFSAEPLQIKKLDSGENCITYVYA